MLNGEYDRQSRTCGVQCVLHEPCKYLVPVGVITVYLLCEVVVLNDEVLNLGAELWVICTIAGHCVLPLHEHEWACEVSLHQPGHVGHLLVQHLLRRVRRAKVNNFQSCPTSV